MPSTAQDIISENPPPIIVRHYTPVSEALRLMVENECSVLPVVNNHDKPDGLITSDSILRGISNFGIGLNGLQVHDVAEKANKYYLDDNIFDILSGVRDKPAVLIIDNNDNLLGVITPYDTAEFFRKRAEDMMLVEDIESGVKAHIEAAYTNVQSGELDQEALDRTISARFGKGAKPFEKLSMFQYIAVLVHENTWKLYGHHFGLKADGIEHLFERVRPIRNVLAHFEREITKSEREQLRFAANWLERNPPIIPESAAELVSTAAIEDVAAPIDEELEPNDSRYIKFGNFLRGLKEQKVKLLFEDIENVIGGDLPASARIHRSWWANDTVSHSQSIEWLDAGWKVASVNLTASEVTFARIRERERAYIDFFAKLLDDLRKTVDFRVLDITPNGGSWIYIAYLPYSGIGQRVSLVYSFARGNRFRTELYIETGDGDENKAIFDYLFQQKDQIETEIGTRLSWERLDSKRASRIALYYDNINILDDEVKLAELRHWAVEAMDRFERAIAERTTQAVDSLS